MIEAGVEVNQDSRYEKDNAVSIYLARKGCRGNLSSQVLKIFIAADFNLRKLTKQ